jgi:hypothetical protein
VSTQWTREQRFSLLKKTKKVHPLFRFLFIISDVFKNSHWLQPTLWPPHREGCDANGGKRQCSQGHTPTPNTCGVASACPTPWSWDPRWWPRIQESQKWADATVTQLLWEKVLGETLRTLLSWLWPKEGQAHDGGGGSWRTNLGFASSALPWQHCNVTSFLVVLGKDHRPCLYQDPKLCLWI